MKNIFKEHYLIIFISIAVGVLMIAPSFYFRYFDSGYQGIDFFGSDSEVDYLAQIQEVYDGYWSSGSVYLADQKDSVHLWQNLGPIIVASLGKISGLSARDINMAVKFFFPALLTLLVYWLFLSIFNRKYLAVLMAVFVMLIQASWTFLNPASWFSILLDGTFPSTNANFLTYARPINPQVSSFFFFGYLLCLWRFLFSGISEKLQRIYGLVGAVILGLSFYVYFFTFSFLFAMNGVLAAIFLVLKDWRSFRKIIYVSLGAGIVGLPYLIGIFKVLQSPFYETISKIQGVIDTRGFIFSRVWWGTAAIFLFLYKGSKQTKILVWSFLAAAFLVTNQQLITGRTAPVPAHYHWYYIAPVSGAILLYILFVYLEKFLGVSRSRLLAVVAVAIFFYAGFMFQKNSYNVGRDYFISVQRYADVFSWLEREISQESAILGNEDVASLLVSYTRHNVYGDRNITQHLIGSDRIKHVYFTELFLKGVTKDNAKDYFYENRGTVGGRFFGHYYRYKNGCYGCFPDAILDGLIGEYKDFLNQDVLANLKKYPLDYAVWDKEQNPEWRLGRFFHGKLYESGNIIVYSAE